MSSSSEEAVECDPMDEAFSMVYLTVSILLVLSTIAGLIVFIIRWKGETILSKIGVIVFFICSVTSLSLLIPVVCWLCLGASYELHEICEQIFIVFYASQSYLVVLLFYYKLEIIFKDTPYAISKCTRMIFAPIFVLYPIVIVIVYIFYVADHSFIETVVGLIVTTLMVSAAALFVAKLVTIYRIHERNREFKSHSDKGTKSNEISAITKITILTLIAVLSTIIHIVAAQTIYESNKTIYHLLELLDVTCNIACVLFSFKAFVKIYTTLCSCCESLCDKHCRYLVICGSSKSSNKRISHTGALSVSTTVAINSDNVNKQSDVTSTGVFNGNQSERSD